VLEALPEQRQQDRGQTLVTWKNSFLYGQDPFPAFSRINVLAWQFLRPAVSFALAAQKTKDHGTIEGMSCSPSRFAFSQWKRAFLARGKRQGPQVFRTT
jgi:hypothetical protein